MRSNLGNPMKPLVYRVIAALLLLALPLSCLSQEASGIRIYLGAPPPRPMALVPGLYTNAGQGAMAGGQEPRAFAIRITRVEGDQFSGKLEVIRLDENGALVRTDSTLTGTIGHAGIATTLGKIVINSTAPLTIQLQDEPLRSSMAEVTGNMRVNGFRLSWQTPDRQMGADKLGTFAAFVVTSEDGYGQVIDRYKEMAADKAQLMAFQASSAGLVESQLKTYMQETDQLLKASSPESNQADVVAKAAALYKKEKALLDGHPPSDEDAAPKEAALMAMQIDAYWSQVAYINERQSEVSRYWLGRGAAISQLIWYSPCVSGTSPSSLSYGASPACSGLATAYDTVQKRMREVSKALGNTTVPETSMECLWHAAHQALRPAVLTIPDYCKRSLATF